MKRKSGSDLGDVGWDVTRAMSLGWELAAPIFVGVLAGHFLDQWLNTGYIFTVALLFWGVFGGFYNLWRFELSLQARDRRRREERLEATENERTDTMEGNTQ